MLEGFGIAGFRSFSNPELQRVGPMSKIHLVAGPNNSGKSNVLMIARRILPALREGARPDLANIDRPIGSPDLDEHELRISIRRSMSDDALREIVENRPRFPPEKIRSLLDGDTTSDQEGVWLEFALTSDRGWQGSRQQTETMSARADMLEDAQWFHNLANRFGGSQGPSPAHRILNGLASRLDPKSTIPEVATIGAFRQISPGPAGDVVEDEHNGPGLIERLNKLQSPGYSGDADRERFGRINHFVQSLLGDGNARIEIPHDKQTINVFYGGQWLPLENYGTGLHEVIILAAAATVLSDHLVCIEEPEIHLHPTLQRKLLRYLDEETDNQYLIATHSAHMLDFGRASISAARLIGGKSELSTALEKSDIAAISFELGARASDLVQANSVIWVEGPSDRIYLRSWIERLDKELIEGIHYSILHYGGRLLRHLSADDSAVDELSGCLRSIDILAS